MYATLVLTCSLITAAIGFFVRTRLDLTPAEVRSISDHEPLFLFIFVIENNTKKY
jgi:hypothetical protein